MMELFELGRNGETDDDRAVAQFERRHQEPAE